MPPPFRFLVAESETPGQRETRRASVGQSSGETYIDTLLDLAPGSTCDRVTPSDKEGAAPGRAEIAAYDAVFLTGSPLHLYEETDETRRAVELMRAVYASGTPAFGSCAGLQIAAVAAGGKVRSNKRGREAAFARRIEPTAEGRRHPLLAGRPHAYDAPAVHTDEVEILPEGAIHLASNATTRVQAAEIRFGEGVFWGVQYHPELSLAEIAAALRRQTDDLLGEGLAKSPEDIEQQAELLEALGAAPNRRDVAWRLGLDSETTDPARRQLELRNFIEHLVKPTRSARGRA